MPSPKFCQNNADEQESFGLGGEKLKTTGREEKERGFVELTLVEEKKRR